MRASRWVQVVRAGAIAAREMGCWVRSIEKACGPLHALGNETRKRKALMKPIAMFERKSLATALVLAGTIGFAGTLLAQYPQEQPKPAATPQTQEQAKPAR